jgi:hypothetical protein
MIREPEVLDMLEVDEAADILQDFSRAGYGFKGNRFEHVKDDGVTVRAPEGFIEIVERSPGLVLAEFFGREYDASVESPDNLDLVRKWRAGLGDIAALEHASRNQAMIGYKLGEEGYREQMEIASFAIRAILRMSYAGYVFCSRSKTFKTPGEMPVFSLPKDLAGALDLVPHLVCDGLIFELRKRAGSDAGLTVDAIDRIDCLAGLRSDVTQLSGELAKIALPQLNSWLEP